MLSDSISSKDLSVNEHKSLVQQRSKPNSRTSVKKNTISFSEVRKQLLPFIKMKLYQFRLNSSYEPDDVLTECFLRLQRKKQSHEEIPNIIGWYRITAYNIIREYNRERLRKESISIDDIRFSENDNYQAEEYGQSEEYEHLRKAFSQLPTKTKELLEMRLVHGLSWSEITDLYRKRGEKVNVATLRKRHQRAIELLRNHFNSLNQ